MEIFAKLVGLVLKLALAFCILFGVIFVAMVFGPLILALVLA